MVWSLLTSYNHSIWLRNRTQFFSNWYMRIRLHLFCGVPWSHPYVPVCGIAPCWLKIPWIHTMDDVISAVLLFRRFADSLFPTFSRDLYFVVFMRWGIFTGCTRLTYIWALNLLKSSYILSSVWRSVTIHWYNLSFMIINSRKTTYHEINEK